MLPAPGRPGPDARGLLRPRLAGARPVLPARARDPRSPTRFDGWFGSLMRNRRDWERYLADSARTPSTASDFAGVGGRPPGAGQQVIEIGAAPATTRCCWPSAASRCAPSTTPAAACGRPARGAKRDGCRRVRPLNLYDLRDVLTRGALRRPQVPAGRGRSTRGELLEALDPRRAGELLAADRRCSCAAAAAPTSRARRPRGGTAPSGAPSTAVARAARWTRGSVEGVTAARLGGRVVHREGFLDGGGGTARRRAGPVEDDRGVARGEAAAVVTTR